MRYIAGLPALAILWLNAYLIRQAFTTHSTAYNNAMHGFWIALSKVPLHHWFLPTWHPQWSLGMPLEYTYAPLIPASMGLIAALFTVTHAHAWHIVAAIIYIAAPALLYIAANRITGSIAYSAAAAVIYSLSALSEIVVPDAGFSFIHIADAKRLYLTFVWDEAPHLAALALLPIVIWSWLRVSEHASQRWSVLAVAATAATVLASTFGATMLTLALICFLLARNIKQAPRLIAFSAAAYVLISPWLPPSLLALIRSNSQLYPQGAWGAGSAYAMVIAIGGVIILSLAIRHVTDDWFLRFWFLFAYLTAVITMLEQYRGWHFIPQSGRYKPEMELAFSILIPFALKPLLNRHRALALVCATILLTIAVRQTITHRRFAKDIIRERPAESLAEYRVANYLQTTAPNTRAFAPGSMAIWMNAFSAVPQFSGGSFPTAPNPVQQYIAWEALHGSYDPKLPRGDVESLWLKSFAIGRYIVVGPGTGEFWKPFGNPDAYYGKFPILWEEVGTRIYEIPDRGPARIVPASAIVANRPANPLDIAALRPFTAAIDSSPQAQFHWLSGSRAQLRLPPLKPDDRVSLAINHHFGWRASPRTTITKDGLGLMVLSPQNCQSGCTVTLTYTGGAEANLTRLASLITTIFCIALLFRRTY